MSYTEAAPIEVEAVHHGFGDQTVLRGVSLVVDGGVFALLGPNGAGKTTLINIAATLLTPDRGAVRILGRDTVQDRRHVKRLISLTGQFPAVDEALTGTENLVMIARLLGYQAHTAETEARALLSRFDLVDSASKRVAAYSGGMRRRLDLAASLFGAPPVLFLDEPTTGLDTRSRQALWLQIRELASNGTTVFLTTQYLEEADALADRVAVLDGGVIVAEGTPEELKRRVGEAVLEIDPGSGAAIRSRPTDGSVEEVLAILARLGASHPEARVTVRRPTMDEVFLDLTGPGRNQETE